MKIWALSAAIVLFTTANAIASDVKLAVTTSFHNSGLSDILLPAIKSSTGIEIKLLVVGTGQAIRLGEAGDVDAILVHSRKAEDAFVAGGFGTHRREIMYNDFVLVGPKSDPANAATAANAADAFAKLSNAMAPFVSRGDDSGTHKREMSIWTSAGIQPEGDWYRAVGAGMGAALNIASGMSGYILSDRASWLNFGNKSDLEIIFEGDRVLVNRYAFLPVDSIRHPHVKLDLVAQLEEWLTSETARELINNYKIAGETLFTFSASP